MEKLLGGVKASEEAIMNEGSAGNAAMREETSMKTEEGGREIVPVVLVAGTRIDQWRRLHSWTVYVSAVLRTPQDTLLAPAGFHVKKYLWKCSMDSLFIASD